MADKTVIDTLDYEIENLELEGKSAAGWQTAIRMTYSGRCGSLFTVSYECSSPHVRCA